MLFLVSLMAAYTFLCLTRNCFSSAMVFIVDEGLLTKFETGVITAVFYVAYALMQVVGGVIIDKINPERFITVGLLGAALSNAVIYFNQNYIVMLLAWSFNAVMQFGVWPAVFKITSSTLVEDMREKSLFIATLASPAGVVSSYAVAAMVSSRWQLNFLISAVGLVIFAIIWELTVASLKGDMAECEIRVEKEIYYKKLDDSFGKTVLKSGLIFVFALAFIRAMFDFGIKGMTPTMIKESYSAVTPVLATVLNIAVLLCGVFGIVVAHIIYPRFIKNESVAVVMFFCGALPLMAVCILLGRINYWIMIALLSLIVMFMSSVSLFTTSYIAAKFNRYGKGATVAGIMNAAASLGIVVAYTLFPGLADSVGWKMTIVAWIVILCVASMLSFLFLGFWSRFLKKYNRV